MKRTLLLIAITSFVCSGCFWNKEHKPTQRGKDIFDCWHHSTNTVVADAALAFDLNCWIVASDSMRQVIENEAFPSTRIRTNDSLTYHLYVNGELEYLINTNGTLLTDDNALWSITVNHDSDNDNVMAFYISESRESYTFNISNSDNNHWHISGDSTNIGGVLDWEMYIPNYGGHPLAYYDFEISGSGTFVQLNNATDVTLQYVIASPLVNYPSDHVTNSWNQLYNNNWFHGKAEITAKKPHAEDQNVTATMEGSQVKITFKNITETYFL